MPDRRESKRQQAWAKREARRVLCQEHADALTELGVPAAVRSGWVVLLDPAGLRVKLDPIGAVVGWAQTPAAEATLPADGLATPSTDRRDGGTADGEVKRFTDDAGAAGR